MTCDVRLITWQICHINLCSKKQSWHSSFKIFSFLNSASVTLSLLFLISLFCITQALAEVFSFFFPLWHFPIFHSEYFKMFSSRVPLWSPFFWWMERDWLTPMWIHLKFAFFFNLSFELNNCHNIFVKVFTKHVENSDRAVISDLSPANGSATDRLLYKTPPYHHQRQQSLSLSIIWAVALTRPRLLYPLTQKYRLVSAPIFPFSPWMNALKKHW